MNTNATARKLEVFSSCPLFAGLRREQLVPLAALAIEQRFAKGQTLFVEGDPCRGLYIIGEGAIKLVKTSASGREITLTVERSPSSIAEVPVFDGGPYPATAVALEDSIVYLISRQAFQQHCLAHPEITLQILRVVGRRLRHLVSLIHALTFGTVRQRLARLLLEVRDEVKSESFPLPMSHEELAMRLGTVREVISRNLSRFQAEGLIRIDRRQVTILDAGALEKEAETEY